MSSPVEIESQRATARWMFRWSDTGQRTISFYDLRCQCQCAGCVDENTGRRILDPARVPADITVTDAKLVGNYALKISWSDGHDTGLYTWDFLRTLLTPPQ